MLRWIKSLFAWRTVKSSSCWVYRENTITGRRKAIWKRTGYAPMISGFMRDGDLVVGPTGAYRIGSEAEHWHR